MNNSKMTTKPQLITLFLLLVGGTTIGTTVSFTINGSGNGIDRLPHTNLMLRIPIHDKDGSEKQPMISIDDHSSSWNKRRKRRRIGLLSTAHDVSDGFADENDKKKDASAKCDPNEDEVYTTAAVSTTTSRRSLLKRILMDSAAMVAASTIFVGCGIPLRYGMTTSTTRYTEPSVLLAQAPAGTTIAGARDTTMMTTTTTSTGDAGNTSTDDESSSPTSILLRDDLAFAETDTNSVL